MEMWLDHLTARAAVHLSRRVGGLSSQRCMGAAAGDPEMAELAREEAEALQEQLEEQGERLKYLLLPKDPLDERNIMLEVRAGTGGEEAALWAADLIRMYQKFADSQVGGDGGGGECLDGMLVDLSAGKGCAVALDALAGTCLGKGACKFGRSRPTAACYLSFRACLAPPGVGDGLRFACCCGPHPSTLRAATPRAGVFR